MMVVSYYTPEYAGEVKDFESCCNAHVLKHCTTAVESRGSWRLNCGRKASFLHEQLLLHKEPILWVDIDGRFRGHPDVLASPVFIENHDFAIWFIPRYRMQPAHVPGGPSSGNDGTASGTMWFNYSPMALRFLEIWMQEEHGQGQWEQQVLGEVWHYARPQELRTFRLSQRYCKVFDVPWFKDEKGPVIIEHMQASRRLKRKVK